MLLHEYGELVNNLFMFFRNKDKPEDGQLKMWYEECKYIPATYRRPIFESMIKEKSLPFNIPRAIKRQYHIMQQSDGGMTEKLVTIAVLFEASLILKKDGLEAFNRFCDGKGIGDNDREAILAKSYYDFKLARRENKDGLMYFDLFQKEKTDTKWHLISSGKNAVDRMKNATPMGGAGYVHSPSHRLPDRANGKTQDDQTG